jgi:hypothetical protein
VSSDDLQLGPVDIVVIGFSPDAPKTGSAIPMFVDLVDRGVVRVLDVLMVQKDAEGTVAALDIKDLGDEVSADLVVFDGANSGMLGEEDAGVAGEALEPGEAAVMICFENTWAAPFVTEVRRNGGHVLAFQRVPAEEVIEIVEALEAS